MCVVITSSRAEKSRKNNHALESLSSRSFIKMTDNTSCEKAKAKMVQIISVVLRRSPTPSTASNTHVEDVSSSEPATPTASPRKEGNNRTLTKKQQRELAPCKVLLEQLEQQDEAWPFLLPVNTKQFPTYKKIIKTPMDLSTIKKKLQDSV